jgi:hypothetical protein
MVEENPKRMTVYIDTLEELEAAIADRIPVQYKLDAPGTVWTDYKPGVFWPLTPSAIVTKVWRYKPSRALLAYASRAMDAQYDTHSAITGKHRVVVNFPTADDAMMFSSALKSYAVYAVYVG